MTNEGYTLSDIAAVTGGNGGGMFGNNGDWGAWIILFLLFGLFGRGGFGFGGNGGGCGDRCATTGDLATQGIVQKLDQQTYGLADSTYALNNTITSGFHGVDNAICNLGYNVQNGFNAIGHQISDCCCATQRAIDGVNYNMATQACETRQAIADSTRSILDFLTQDKIATLTAENQSLKFQASQANQNAFITANQEAQTAELIRRLGRDCPVPAYVVPNPNCCYNPLGFGYGGGYGNNGCGCGF